MITRIRLRSFEQLEQRAMLAALFPAYVDGQFTLGGGTDGTPYGLQNTFLLETNPAATKTIYLDFDGHHSVNDGWGHDIVFPPFNREGSPSNFTNSELLEIQETFQNVAEDFAAFDINVTTQDPGVAALSNSGGSDEHYGVRALATQPTNGFGNGIGGVAFVGSFSSGDVPVFVFNKGANVGAMTVSHEVGHALGLSHDGLNADEYHPGTGSGETSWGPIMGAPFGSNVTQWSKGEYSGATTTQDDLSIMTSYGFGFAIDDHDGGFPGATVIQNPTSSFQWGVIGAPNDYDMFKVTVDDGLFEVSVSSFEGRPNLDARLQLFDSRGTVVASDNPVESTSASLAVQLTADTYWVGVSGIGRPGRYTSYGSLGFYTLVTGSSTVAGDFVPDGILNVADLDLLTAEIYSFSLGGGDPATFDLTGDNVVDLADRDAWLLVAGNRNLGAGISYALGDANLDGVVDGQDFVAWNDNKFDRFPVLQWSAGNFNGDSFVDGQDFVIWNNNKFTSASRDQGATPHIVRLADGPALPLAHDAVWHHGDHAGNWNGHQSQMQRRLGQLGHDPTQCCCPNCTLATVAAANLATNLVIDEVPQNESNRLINSAMIDDGSDGVLNDDALKDTYSLIGERPTQAPGLSVRSRLKIAGVDQPAPQDDDWTVNQTLDSAVPRGLLL